MTFMIVIFGADLLHEKSIGSLIYNARRCYLLVLSTGFVLEDGVECDGPTDRLTSTIFNARTTKYVIAVSSWRDFVTDDFQTIE